MKRFLLFTMALVTLISFASAELSDSEQQYLGAWVMYMKKGETTYLFTITFFEDRQVVLKTLSFSGSTLASDHKASGKWSGFTSNTIVLTLAGNDFTGTIYDDGLFGLFDYKTHEPYGYFSPCPDLSYRME